MARLLRGDDCRPRCWVDLARGAVSVTWRTQFALVVVGAGLGFAAYNLYYWPELLPITVGSALAGHLAARLFR